MTATNYVTNPSAEVNTTGWTAVNCAVTRDSTSQPGTGAFSFKMVATGGSVMSMTSTISGLTIGKSYVASLYSKVPAGNFGLQITISGISTSVSGAALDFTTFFARTFVGFVATATSHTVVVQSSISNAASDTAYADRISVTDGNTLLPYFDGSYPFGSWTGTAFASTSTNSAFTAGQETTEEVVVVNGLCLNTYAFNGTTKTGRYTMSPSRGDNVKVPSGRGETFTPNKPIDSGTWTLSMFILGCNPDGSIPSYRQQRMLFENNLNQIMQYCMNTSNPVTIYAWQADGSVRMASATLAGSNAPDLTLNMGGLRAELSLVFEILSGVWTDYLATTVVGTASAGWANQSLNLSGLINGTVPIEDAVITVTGPATNPRITNAATGVWVQYTGTVPGGQTWIVDSSQWTSKVNAVSVLTTTSHNGYYKFMLIDPGLPSAAPNVTMTCTSPTSATNLSVTASRQHWFA